MSFSPLPRSFYLRPDVVNIAVDLLGKYLVTCFEGIVTSGMITETEAYAGISDRASHAFGGRRTPRTEIMYSIGGTAYVYLCYGIHSLFNVVTNVKDIPHAVLIRGIIPFDGIPEMLNRVGNRSLSADIGIGPGKASRLLGIHYIHTGLDLAKYPVKGEPSIWIEDRAVKVTANMIRTGPRIGVDYAGEDAWLPYRFWIPADHINIRT